MAACFQLRPISLLLLVKRIIFKGKSNGSFGPSAAICIPESPTTLLWLISLTPVGFANGSAWAGLTGPGRSRGLGSCATTTGVVVTVSRP